MSTESFTTNKKERMQEGVSLAQGEKKHLAGQQLTPRYEVVQQLKDARKAQDMTQEVLAERVGTKKSNISRFESGKYNPSLDFLINRYRSGLSEEGVLCYGQKCDIRKWQRH